MGLRSGVAVSVVWAVATAVIQPLAWELPYAADMALKRRKKKSSNTSPAAKEEENDISRKMRRLPSVSFGDTQWNTQEQLNTGVPIVAQQIKNQHSVHEAAGYISGLTQWVKDSALPQAVV